MDEKMLLQERAKIVETIITRAWADESFKAQLLENPAKALEAAFATKLPPSISVKAIEETAETRYLVIPYRPKAGDELSNEELEAVAGGASGGRAVRLGQSLAICESLSPIRIAEIETPGILK